MGKDIAKKIIAAVVAISAVIGSGYYGYNKGAADGYDEGYSYGYGLGYTAGVELANGKYHQGYEDGYKDAGGAQKPNFISGDNNPQRNSYGEVIVSGRNTSTSDNSSSVNLIVYITNTGSKYHQSWCSYLHSSSNAVDLSWAISNGYSACSRCW